jgi:DNA-binding NtrC family response regulator
MPAMGNRILLIDDEALVLTALKRALHEEDLEITTATSGEEGLEVMRNESFKVVISDERMPGMSGSEFLTRVRELYPDTIRMMLTGHATLEAAMRAVNDGETYRFFAKPWNDQELIFALRSAMEKYDLAAENRRLLAVVQSQAQELQALEVRYPGIAKVQRDRTGAFVLPELSEAERKRILAACEK